VALKVNSLDEVPKGYTGEVLRNCYPNTVDRFWYKNGSFHNEDGPAREYNIGDPDAPPDFRLYSLEGLDHTENSWRYALYKKYRDTDPQKARDIMCKILGETE
jgi:hypothetical protein